MAAQVVPAVSALRSEIRGGTIQSEWQMLACPSSPSLRALTLVVLTRNVLLYSTLTPLCMYVHKYIHEYIQRDTHTLTSDTRSLTLTHSLTHRLLYGRKRKEQNITIHTEMGRAIYIFFFPPPSPMQYILTPDGALPSALGIFSFLKHQMTCAWAMAHATY